MPTYEYKCAKCKKTFEIYQSIKDKSLTACPDKMCNGKIKRLIGSGGGFIFKGPGFYATDYRSQSYKEKAKKEEGAKTQSPCAACDKKECK